MSHPVKSRCLGLIGGLGVAAAIHYYQELAKAHSAAGIPMRLLMNHADVQQAFRHAQAGEAKELALYLAGLIDALRSGGAEVAAIPAVMPHLAIHELLPISPLPLVNLLEVVADEIRRRKLRRVALFGTRFSVQTAMFGQLKEAEVVMPRPEEIDYIHDTYFALVSKGSGTEEQHRGLTALAHTLQERDGVDAIVLAGTDLTLLFNETNTDFPHVDCARVHLEAIMRTLAG